MANIPLKTIKFPGLANTYTIPEVSTDLTASGKAADAKKVGDELSDINERIDGLGDGVPTEVRQAMLALFNSAAYAETGLTDEVAVIASWAAVVTAISLNQSSISISGASTSQLVATTTPAGGTVIWASSDTSVATVSSSGLVTGVGNGSCTITASCGGKTATCSVTVSGFATLTSISAVYTQGGTVYDTDTLDSLKNDLVVTAHWDVGSDTTVASADYNLSGTLTTGTCTITVSHGGKTTTFTVNVSRQMSTMYSISDLILTDGVIDSNGDLANDSTKKVWNEFVSAEYLSGFVLINASGSTPPNTLYLSEYDNSKEFLANTSGTGAAYEANTLSKYVKIGFPNTIANSNYNLLKLQEVPASVLTIADTYLDTNGEETSQNGRYCSDYIDISGYEASVYCTIGISDAFVICFYDSGKSLLARTGKSTNQKNSGTVPTGAKYIRMAGGLTSITSFLL